MLFPPIVARAAAFSSLNLLKSCPEGTILWDEVNARIPARLEIRTDLVVY
jgi:hypothetical protein